MDSDLIERIEAAILRLNLGPTDTYDDIVNRLSDVSDGLQAVVAALRARGEA